MVTDGGLPWHQVAARPSALSDRAKKEEEKERIHLAGIRAGGRWMENLRGLWMQHLTLLIASPPP
jgi:hypothetical protein